MMNKRYFLALNRISHIGPRTVMKLLSFWPQLEELFRLSPEQMEQAGLPVKMAQAIHQFQWSDYDADLLWEQTSSNRYLLTWDDPGYPALLKEIHDPPIALYAQGNLAAFQQPTLAMVGTRNPSITGGETAYRFAAELAAQQITVVSGLAQGIDTQAHRGCLTVESGRTIAVMATGIDRVYPLQNRKLAEQIQASGLIITEFPLKSAPASGHFPRRNRIISGLSLATLVIEAATKSGSLITARMALEQNRDVFAVPGSIHNPQSRGCHYLLQQGAKLITSTQDILDELKLGNALIIADNTLPLLATTANNLVKCIGFEITTIDQICQRSGLSVNNVTCELAELELQGIIKAIPGGYTRCL